VPGERRADIARANDSNLQLPFHKYLLSCSCAEPSAGNFVQPKPLHKNKPVLIHITPQGKARRSLRKCQRGTDVFIRYCPLHFTSPRWLEAVVNEAKALAPFFFKTPLTRL
jgi:hypothetical protein